MPIKIKGSKIKKLAAGSPKSKSAKTKKQKEVKDQVKKEVVVVNVQEPALQGVGCELTTPDGKKTKAAIPGSGKVEAEVDPSGESKMELDLPLLPQNPTNAEVRVWYNEQLKKIDNSGPLTQENAQRVVEQRNAVKQKARDLMGDRAAAEQLAKERPIRPFEYYKEKYTAEGLEGEALWDRILERGKKPNPAVNQKFGIGT